MIWIDTHCHLDAPEFALSAEAEAVRERAGQTGVALCVIPAVRAADFAAVERLARRCGDAYALGIHPLWVPEAQESDLKLLNDVLDAARDDPQLAAVGEIGLDFFVPALCTPEMRDKQEHFYREQLRLARRYELPVILHVRRSADRLLKHLREQAPASGAAPWKGIAHAFNGSDQQAMAFIEMGLKLGFGGAVTFERALQLRRLASSLPIGAIVLETDAPDMPPHWLYRTAQQRAGGEPQARNEPGELPRIGAAVAILRGMTVEDLAAATSANAVAALPKIGALLPC